MKKTHKEKFLDMLRDLNVHVKEDIIKEKKKEEQEMKEKIEEIIPKKKLFKHENPLKKLRRAYDET